MHAHDRRRADRRDAEGRGLDASQDDALPVPVVRAAPSDSGAARVRADQPARHLRSATGQLVRRVPARARASTCGCSTGGCPDDEDGETGLDYYVCDALPWACARCCAAPARRRCRWSAGASAARCARCTRRSRARQPGAQPRAADDADRHDRLAVRALGRERGLRRRLRRGELAPVVPGRSVDFANKMMKPVTNFWTTNRRLAQGVSTARPTARRIRRWPSGWRTTRRSPRRRSASGSRGCTRRTGWCRGASACAARAWTWARSSRTCSS